MIISVLDLDFDDLRELFFQEELLEFGLEVVEVSNWTQDYKYQDANMIVLRKETGKFFTFPIKRSGSPFTDWEYEFWENVGQEVEKKEVVTKSMKWVSV